MVKSVGKVYDLKIKYINLKISYSIPSIFNFRGVLRDFLRLLEYLY